ncbi:MAG: hypothetical protein JRI97_10375 [Deltaproteobacteria bacterium]|nr:hypothetical protein [Deltaproteobacteria bacterium]
MDREILFIDSSAPPVSCRSSRSDAARSRQPRTFSRHSRARTSTWPKTVSPDPPTRRRVCAVLRLRPDASE